MTTKRDEKVIDFPGAAVCKAPAVKVSGKAASIQEVDAYSAPEVVDQISWEIGVSKPDAEQLFKDLKRFLWLASISGVDLVPTIKIDGAWHIFLNSPHYSQFCEYVLFARVKHEQDFDYEFREKIVNTLFAIEEYLPDSSGENWVYRAS